MKANISARLRERVTWTDVGSFVGHFTRCDPPSSLQLEAADVIDTLVTALEMVLIGFDGMQDGNGDEAPELIRARAAIRFAKGKNAPMKETRNARAYEKGASEWTKTNTEPR